MSKRLDRSSIEDKYKWSISEMYPNEEMYNQDIKKVNELCSSIITYKDKMFESSKVLFNVLTEEEELDRVLTNLYVYTRMYYDQDTTNNDAIDKNGMMNKLMSHASSHTYFINVELLQHTYDEVLKYMEENKDLEYFRINLEKVFKYKTYTLGISEEKILSNFSEILTIPKDVYSTLTNTDLKYGNIIIDGKEVELTDSNYGKLIKSSDREVRKSAFKTLYKKYEEFKNTFAALLKSNVKDNSEYYKIKNYNSALEASLYKDNISISLYENLINKTTDRIHLLHDYVKLKKKELKLEKLHMYDFYVPMISTNKEYSYEEAFDIVINALSILKSDYVEILTKARDEKWIDVYDNSGKRSGAYSFGSYDSKPYILLNYNNTFEYVSTLAHELGHSVHSYLSKTQSYNKSSYPIFMAEIASTVNEVLLNKYMYKNTDDVNIKKNLLNDLMETIKSTFFRQTMFAEFEKLIFEKEAANITLTEKEISSLYYDLNKKYYGDSLIHDEEVRLEWARIPHFYNPFYVYKYATGIAIAIKIATRILNNDEETIKIYKEVLSSGCAEYPRELLLKLNIDINKEDLFDELFNVFEEAIKEYNSL